MNDILRTQLTEAVKLKGEVIKNDARLCEALLNDLCVGGSKRQIKALAGAVAAGVVTDLGSPMTELSMEARLTEYRRRLCDDFGFDKELALWAIESWALELGVLNEENILRLAPGVMIELVSIPAGEFLMGNNDAEKDSSGDETPQHKVILSKYWIGKYDVTNAQFAAFVKATGNKTTAEREGSGWTYIGRWKEVKGADWQHPTGPGSNLNGKDNHPVVLVSWDDAVAFCAWVSKVTGRKVKLPTEAQWEKAARGSDGRLYPWGNSEPDATKLNFFNTHVDSTTPVGKYSPAGDGPFGVSDMAGNVFQWTSSLYKSYPYDPDDGREDQTSRDARMLRGGAFVSARCDVRSAFRFKYVPDVRVGFYGFRVIVQPFTATVKVRAPLPPARSKVKHSSTARIARQPDEKAKVSAVTPMSKEYLLTLAPGVMIEMVRIPAGEFLMGSADNDKDASPDEKPQHKVMLDEYLIGKYPVTNSQYAVFLQATNHAWNKQVGSENHPVVRISWDDAVAFCAWVSQVTRRKVKLPTEAQWEKAARGTDGRLFPWGNSEPDASKLSFDGNSKGTLTVGKYSPAGDSPYGVADMAGNVFNWTSSLYKPYPYDPDDGREDQTSHTGRVLRSGQFGVVRMLIRSALRCWYLPVFSGYDGFRVVASPMSGVPTVILITG